MQYRKVQVDRFGIVAGIVRYDIHFNSLAVIVDIDIRGIVMVLQQGVVELPVAGANGSAAAALHNQAVELGQNPLFQSF